MKIISHKNKLIKLIKKEKNLGFVPTMGCIHAGHLSLVKKSIKQCTKTIVSIFVNKPQFNRKSDFQKYPRVFNKDKSMLKKLKVDFLFHPTEKQIYPYGPNKNIKINSFSKKLCGKNRSGHFESVADVIDRFIKIIKPKRIYFGEKDMQQLKILEHFVKKNHPYTKIISCKTVREKNGIAYSSRNNLLTVEQKIIASKIFKLLIKEKKKLIKNKLFIRKIKSMIYKLGVKKIDYIEVLNINSLIKPYKKKKEYRIFIAYYLQTTRLIDNI